MSMYIIFYLVSMNNEGIKMCMVWSSRLNPLYKLNYNSSCHIIYNNRQLQKKWQSPWLINSPGKFSLVARFIGYSRTLKWQIKSPGESVKKFGSEACIHEYKIQFSKLGHSCKSVVSRVYTERMRDDAFKNETKHHTTPLQCLKNLSAFPNISSENNP